MLSKNTFEGVHLIVKLPAIKKIVGWEVSLPPLWETLEGTGKNKRKQKVITDNKTL